MKVVWETVSSRPISPTHDSQPSIGTQQLRWGPFDSSQSFCMHKNKAGHEIGKADLTGLWNLNTWRNNPAVFWKGPGIHQKFCLHVKFHGDRCNLSGGNVWGTLWGSTTAIS